MRVYRRDVFSSAVVLALTPISSRCVLDLKRKTLQAFIAAHVKDGSTVKCDGYQAYDGLKNVSVDAKVYDCASGDLKWLHKALSNLKAFLTGTYHGRCEQLQSYLDEYYFRFNRRRSPE